MLSYNIVDAHSFVVSMKETENVIPNDIGDHIT